MADFHCVLPLMGTSWATATKLTFHFFSQNTWTHRKPRIFNTDIVPFVCKRSRVFLGPGRHLNIHIRSIRRNMSHPTKYEATRSSFFLSVRQYLRENFCRGHVESIWSLSSRAYKLVVGRRWKTGLDPNRSEECENCFFQSNSTSFSWHIVYKYSTLEALFPFPPQKYSPPHWQ